MDLKKRFEQNLEEVKEDNPTATLAEQVQLAIDRTVEDATRLVQRYGWDRLAAHQEGVNKAFFG